MALAERRKAMDIKIEEVKVFSIFDEIAYRSYRKKLNGKYHFDVKLIENGRKIVFTLK